MTKKEQLGKFLTLLRDHQRSRASIVASRSKLIQTNNIADALQHACPKTYCVSDIDATIYKTCQYLGGSIWSERYLPELKKKHQDDEKALTEILALFDRVQAKTKVKPVEYNTSAVMQHLAANSMGLLGLTARRIALKDTTHRQLTSVGVKMHDVIFTAGSPKGPILAEHLLKRGELPERVLYIEDIRLEAESVKDSLSALGIETVCLHYTHAHEQAFCLKIAEKQREIFEAHGVLIEDEHAEALLQLAQRRPSPSW